MYHTEEQNTTTCKLTSQGNAPTELRLLEQNERFVVPARR